MGYRTGDTLVAVNGTAIHRGNYGQIMSGLAANAKENEVLKVEVIRLENGQPKRVVLEQPIEFVNQKRFNVLRLSANPTEEQRKLREAWMNVRTKGA